MSSLVNFLKQSGIFYQLTPTQLELVANLCQEVMFDEGDTIFRENSSSCETYPQLGYRLRYNLAADLAMKMRNTDLRVREQLLYQPQEK